MFKSKGDDEYTDADIDTLIRRGEERSRLDDERFQQTANSLANFSLTGEEKSMYEFDGEDFTGQKASATSPLNLPYISPHLAHVSPTSRRISPGERELVANAAQAPAQQ